MSKNFMSKFLSSGTDQSDQSSLNNRSNKDSKPPIYWTPTLVFIITFAIAVTAVPYYGFVHGYDWEIWVGFLVFLIFNGMSITGGYHRLWSHNAYKAHPILRWFFALFGAAATQNSILVWASGHRRHHRHVDDDEKDPYSAGRGLWFSHIGWMLRNYPSGAVDFSNVKDLQRDKIVMFQHKHYLALVLGMNFGVPLIFGLIHGDIIGALLVIGVLRLVVSHHTTFFINSLAHFWGTQPYTDENSARDNPVLAFFTYGEGYHNYHHIFQNDYRNGIRWYHWDPTKWLIAACSVVGLTSQLQRVSDFKIQRAILSMQFQRANEKLKSAKNADHWRAHLEKEYQQFLDSMSEWRQLQQEWVQSQKDKIQSKKEELFEKKDELFSKWNQAVLTTRFKELEYALKMQQKRLQVMALQMA